MIKPIPFFLVVLIFSCAFMPQPVLPADETITISTYYPAPYGIYKELRSQRVAIGENYINNAQYCWAPKVCTNQINANADLVVEDRVGMGTRNPQTKLDIFADPSQPQVNIGDNAGNWRFWVGANFHIINCGNNPDDCDSGPEWWGKTRIFVAGQNHGALSGNVGIGSISPTGTDLPKATLDVRGEAKIGNTGLGCNADAAGALRYNNNQIEYCDGTRWASVGGSPTVTYAQDMTSRQIGPIVRLPPPTFDPWLSLSVPVKAGEIVKVSFAGSIKGATYSGVWLTAGPGTPISGWMSSSIIQAWGDEWVPFHAVGFWRADADGTLTFKQGYYKSDLFNLNHAVWVNGRLAFAEKVKF